MGTKSPHLITVFLLLIEVITNTMQGNMQPCKQQAIYPGKIHTHTHDVYIIAAKYESRAGYSVAIKDERIEERNMALDHVCGRKLGRIYVCPPLDSS